MSHHIKKCMHCETVLGQCRCPSKEKTVIWDQCKKCAADPRLQAIFCGDYDLRDDVHVDEPPKFAKKDDYSWVTQAQFDEKLMDIVDRYSVSDIIQTVPNIHSEISEYFNNQVLEELEKERD